MLAAAIASAGASFAVRSASGAESELVEISSAVIPQREIPPPQQPPEDTGADEQQDGADEHELPPPLTAAIMAAIGH